ncbi:MAG: protein-L-isoaspartate(D-aspartate) O-methyltransferase [Nanoarchaeota archaeon]|nr:protein-L-isoaspartate(D-aspartate) O-methyltransferase [Nanoarchaeota archaeon]
MSAREMLLGRWNGCYPEPLLKAFKAILREKFILDEDFDQAYGDYPLSIGHGQTISQPSTVMIMLDALELRPGQKVLEIGAGSGWNAALMGYIVGKKGRVYSTEIVSELADYAKKNVKKTKLKNVTIMHHDGSIGLEKYVPFDRIIVTAACPSSPDKLISQLKEEGILVAPVSGFFDQDMVVYTKHKDGITEKRLGSFSFVPLKGALGYQ